MIRLQRMDQIQATQVLCFNRLLPSSIACLALLLACNSAWAELVKGDDPDKLYVRAFAKINGQNAGARQAAKISAEMNALSEFIDVALKENLLLPESLARLENQIKNSIYLSAAKGNIEGALVLQTAILNDGRAACVMEIPKSNLDNFKSLDVRQNPLQILDYIQSPKLLKLEIALELAATPDLSIINPSSPLAIAMQGGAIAAISPLWVRDVKIDETILEQVKDDEILYLLENALALPALQDLLLAHVAKRGYDKSAHFFTGHLLPCNEPLPACREFLDSITLDPSDTPPFLNILRDHACAIAFSNAPVPNDQFSEAQQIFASQEPNFDTIRQLIYDSFLINVSDDAMNLLGRCYEEDGKYQEALLCYFQTYSINPNHAYVKLNLANCFHALGEDDRAQYWAAEAVKDTCSDHWTKEQANHLLLQMQSAEQENSSETQTLHNSTLQ